MTEWLLPIRLVSEGNIHEHWTKKHKRHKQQQILINSMANTTIRPILPVLVILTRISPRKLDDDNLQYAFKSLRDYIADYLIPGLKLGRADNDPRITWQYKQQKGKPHAVKIQFIETFSLD